MLRRYVDPKKRTELRRQIVEAKRYENRIEVFQRHRIIDEDQDQEQEQEQTKPSKEQRPKDLKFLNSLQGQGVEKQRQKKTSSEQMFIKKFLDFKAQKAEQKLRAGKFQGKTEQTTVFPYKSDNFQPPKYPNILPDMEPRRLSIYEICNIKTSKPSRK